MLAPLEKQVDSSLNLKDQQPSTSKESKSGSRWGFFADSLISRDSSRTEIQFRHWNSLEEQLLSMEQLKDLANRVPQTRVDPLTRESIQRGLRPLPESVKQSHVTQSPFSIPESDDRTRPLHGFEKSTAASGDFGHPKRTKSPQLVASNSDENNPGIREAKSFGTHQKASHFQSDAPVILDPQVRSASFQEIVETGQDEESDSTQAESPGNKGIQGSDQIRKQEPIQGETSPLTVNELSLDGLRKKVQDQIELVKSNETLDENSKQEQLKQLNKATALVQKATSLQATIAEETRKKNEFEDDHRKLQEELKAPFQPESPEANQSAEKLQLSLQEKRQLLNVKTSDRALVETQLEKRDKRITEIPGLRTAIQEQQKDIKEQMAALKLQPDDLASSLILSAKELAVLMALEEIDLEISRQGQVGVLLPLKRTLLTREIKMLESEIATWESAYDKRREFEIELQKQQAQKARERAIEADPGLAELAIRNHALAEDRSQLTRLIQLCDDKLAETDAELAGIDAKWENIKDKIETAGGLATNHGTELIELRRSLMETFESQSRIEQINRDLQKYRLIGLSLKEERRSLAARDKLVKALVDQRNLSRMDESSNSQLPLEEFQQMAQELIESKRNSLTNLEKDYQKYRACLTRERERLVQLINKVQDVRQYIDKNALWVRSANQISLSDFGNAKAAMDSFFEPAEWIEMFNYGKSRMIDRPYRSALAGFLILAVFVVSRRLKGNA